MQGQRRLVWLCCCSDSRSEVSAFCPCSSLCRAGNRQALKNTSWMSQSSLRTEFCGRRCFNHPNVRVHFLFPVAAPQSAGDRGIFLKNHGFGAADAERHVRPGDAETGEGLPSPAGSPSCSGDAVSGRCIPLMCPCGRCGWAYLRTVICRTQASPPRWSRQFCRGSWVRIVAGDAES